MMKRKVNFDAKGSNDKMLIAFDLKNKGYTFAQCEDKLVQVNMHLFYNSKISLYMVPDSRAKVREVLTKKAETCSKPFHNEKKFHTATG